MQEQIEAVQRMQEYIEKHLRENISFADVAKASLFSPWRARRLFLEYTGVTPSEYIRKLRLKQSVLKLRDEDVNILDVALDSGFGSVDGYQRAFRSMKRYEQIVRTQWMTLHPYCFRLQKCLIP